MVTGPDSDSASAPPRRTLLVDPAFQLGLVAIANGVALTLLVLFGVAVVDFLQKVQAYGLLHGVEAAHPLQVFLRERQRGLFAVLGFVGVTVVTVITLGTLVITHRIAGPIYRLRTHLDRVAEGATDAEVVFRPRDRFQGLARSCNRALKLLRSRKA